MSRRIVVLGGVALLGAALPATPATAQAGPARAAWQAPPTGDIRLPAPTGPLPVGTSIAHLIDHDRTDPYAGDGRSRELMAQIWYPARRRHGLPTAPYMAPGSLAALERSLDAAPGSLSRLVPHARLDAPPSHRPGGWPVILFSHGWGGGRSNATALVEDLVSHGYVVIAVDHTYDAGTVEFPRGRLVASVLPRVPTEADDRLNIETRVADLAFTLEWFLRRRTGRSRHILDATRVGVLGHSMGGSAAGELMLTDERIRAGVNLDGAFFGSRFPESGLDRPFLLSTADGEHTTWTRLQANHRGWGRHLAVLGSGHYSQVDGPFFVEPAELWKLPADQFAALFGTLGARRAATITRSYVRAFFNMHLRGESSPLLDGPSTAFPEVAFRWTT
ncbi:alpha/beta hydrolase family protein [Rhizohabitans arisaemae]|uniref:alpha/beta hydrolase family protein n=1 Tax=Rhizohabitans arisaemae TaxID=2720610 RepID=UPI0024B10577|nr:dienelactone hydrolase family protein [Rhizohabitans arisaemae]